MRRQREVGGRRRRRKRKREPTRSEGLQPIQRGILWKANAAAAAAAADGEELGDRVQAGAAALINFFFFLLSPLRAGLSGAEGNAASSSAVTSEMSPPPWLLLLLLGSFALFAQPATAVAPTDPDMGKSEPDMVIKPKMARGEDDIEEEEAEEEEEVIIHLNHTVGKDFKQILKTCNLSLCSLFRACIANQKEQSRLPNDAQRGRMFGV